MRISTTHGVLAWALVASVPAAQIPRTQPSSDAPGSAVGELSAAALLESLLKSNSMELALQDGRLQGPGRAWILENAAETQFVAVAEQHFVREIPELTAALFDLLQSEAGFTVLALESDPVSARQASRPPLRGNLEVLADYAAKFPFAFTFPSDQELAMIASAGRCPAAAIVGLDQSFGVRHTIEFAAAADPQVLNHEAVLRLRDAAAPLERRRSPESETAFAGLRDPAAFEAVAKLPDQIGADAAWAFRQMALSERIFRPYSSPTATPADMFESCELRENNMKQLLVAALRERQAGGGPTRALLKLGHAHLEYGRQATTGQLTLGNFAAELARSNGLGMLSIAVFVHGPQGHWRSMHAWRGYEPLCRAAGTDGWTLIDLRPLRKLRFDPRLGPWQPLMDASAGYDAVLVLGGANPATFDQLTRRWQAAPQAP